MRTLFRRAALPRGRPWTDTRPRPSRSISRPSCPRSGAGVKGGFCLGPKAQGGWSDLGLPNWAATKCPLLPPTPSPQGGRPIAWPTAALPSRPATPWLCKGALPTRDHARQGQLWGQRPEPGRGSPGLARRQGTHLGGEGGRASRGQGPGESRGVPSASLALSPPCPCDRCHISDKKEEAATGPS